MSLMEEGVVGKSSLSPFSTLFFGNYSQEFLFGNNILRAFNSIQIHETIEMIKFMLKYSSQEILKFFSLLLPFSCPVFYCYLLLYLGTNALISGMLRHPSQSSATASELDIISGLITAIGPNLGASG